MGVGGRRWFSTGNGGLYKEVGLYREEGLCRRGERGMYGILYRGSGSSTEGGGTGGSKRRGAMQGGEGGGGHLL